MDFSKDCLLKPNKDWLKLDSSISERRSCPKGHYEKHRVVILTLAPKRALMDKRKCLSEHPFGSIKRAMEAAYFLLRGMAKAAGEFALFCLGYNLQRAINILGFEKLMAIMA